MEAKKRPEISIDSKSMCKCSYCGLNSLKITKKILNYNLFYCERCKNLFTDVNESSVKVNVRIYDSNYLNRYDEREKQLVNRFIQRIKQIDSYTKNGNILDVGCSTGLFLHAVDEYSVNKWTLFGIDLNFESIKRAKQKYKNIHFKLGLLGSVKYKKEYFDVITCFDVLEHDKNLNLTLKEIYRIFKPGGILVVQSPNYKSLMAELCGNNWDWWSVPDHVFHFSPNGLEEILIENGFKILKMDTWDPMNEFVGNVSGTIKKYFSKSLFINKVVAKVFQPLLYIVWLISLPHKFFFKSGGLILIYATK